MLSKVGGATVFLERASPRCEGQELAPQHSSLVVERARSIRDQTVSES